MRQSSMDCRIVFVRINYFTTNEFNLNDVTFEKSEPMETATQLKLVIPAKYDFILPKVAIISFIP